MPERSHREIRHYRKYLKVLKKADAGCEFCKITSESKQFIEETSAFTIIHNIFPYSYWDHLKVTDHLMIIPKTHTDTMSHFTPDQAAEYVRLLGSYESRGYNVYSRTPSSKQKSVAHQHTHLIKSEGKLVKAIFYIKKPYARIVI